jgi:hypothetical protein
MQEIAMRCAKRGREVRLVLTNDAVHDSQAPVMDEELVCLDVGEACGEGACPVCGHPVAVMDAMLVRSGLPLPPGHRRVKGTCEACGRETEQVLSAGGFLTCTECGATRGWATA